MPIRALEIQRLHEIAERTSLLPAELRSLQLVLVFDTIYDAAVFRRDPDARGGTWGGYFDHRDRRAAHVLLTLHGFIETIDTPIRRPEGEVSTIIRYITTVKGEELLAFLKSTAGIE